MPMADPDDYIPAASGLYDANWDETARFKALYENPKLNAAGDGFETVPIEYTITKDGKLKSDDGQEISFEVFKNPGQIILEPNAETGF